MQQEDTNAKIRAIYLCSFTKYFDWPPAYKEGDFIIGIYGSNPSLYSELTRMASTKTVGSQKYDIKSISSTSGLGKCHILFVTADKSDRLNEIVGSLKGKSTLIVTEKTGLAKQGAAINFVIMDNKQKFELNRSNAEKYNLKVSSNLATLAIANY